MARKRPGKKKQPAKTGMGLWWVIALLVLALASAFALPTVVILTIGMLPAWVAFMVDPRPEKAAGKCVLSLNIAGVAPYLVELWTAGQGGMDNAFFMLTDPMTWLVIYGAATIGWLIYFMMPYLVGAVIEMRADRRKGKLADLRKKLIEEWGEDISGATPPPKK